MKNEQEKGAGMKRLSRFEKMRKEHLEHWGYVIEEEVGKSNEERQLRNTHLCFLMLDSIHTLLIAIKYSLYFLLVFVFLILSNLAL